MLWFGKQKAVVREALIQMSLCISFSPKATAACSNAKGSREIGEGPAGDRSLAFPFPGFLVVLQLCYFF